jgi:hypothetical protein
LIKAVSYKIHTVHTDNGIQFTDLPKNRLGPTARWRAHMFDMLCDANSIEHAGNQAKSLDENDSNIDRFSARWRRTTSRSSACWAVVSL